MQPRKCPQCDTTISDDANYSFDKELNLICGECGKIAFPTSWQSNSEINDAIREKKGSWGTNSWKKNNVAQPTFPRQTAGLGIGSNYGTTPASTIAAKTAEACAARGPNGQIHGLSRRRAQVPCHSSAFNAFNDCVQPGVIPHDDVDNYNEYPFYA